MQPYRPALRRPSISPFLGQTFDQMFGWSPIAGDMFRIFFHTSTAYLGISVGLSAKPGFLKYFGWFLGLGQGIAAVCDAASLVQRAAGTHPAERVTPTPGTAPALPAAPPVVMAHRVLPLMTTPIPR